MPDTTPAAADQATGRSSNRYFALAGMVGPILFVLVFSIAGFLRPGYSAIRDPVSDLGVGNRAWIQNVNFFVFGPLIVVFAVGFFRAMRYVIGRRSAMASTLLIALTGIGVSNSGIFTAAPGTEVLHLLTGFLLTFGSAILSIGFTGWRLRRVPGWERFARYSLLTAAGAVALIAFTCAVLNPESPLAEADIGGLLQRALLVEVFAWHVVLECSPCR